MIMEVKNLLQKAVKLHQEHMDSSEAPSVASQKKLMGLIRAALDAVEEHEMEMKEEIGQSPTLAESLSAILAGKGRIRDLVRAALREVRDAVQ